MRKSLLIIAVALLVASFAAPAFADVQFLYGGQFRVRYNASDNNVDGTDHNGYFGNFAPQTFTAFGKPNSYYNSNDNRNFLDQRLRLYFTFVGSKNLKVVTKFEIGDTKWGDGGDGADLIGVRGGQNGGGGIGADQVAIEVKNAYIEFNIPNTPSTALIGVQTLTLLDSWILDDDFSAAVLLTKLDPFRIAVGYVGGQYGAEKKLGTGVSPMGASGLSNTYVSYTNQDLNIDDVFIAVDYTCAPFKASLIGFYQDAHKTSISVDRSSLTTPVSATTGQSDSGFLPVQANIKSNNLFDLGLNLTYKVDYLLAYVNFVQNFGSVDYNNPVQTTTMTQQNGKEILNPNGTVAFPALPVVSSSDYTGWMLDAGVTYFCAPWTFNVGGFYTTGPHFTSKVSEQGTGALNANVPATSNQNPAVTSGNTAVNNISTVGGMPFKGTTSTDIEWFTTPLGSGKYTSELMGGGVLGDDVFIHRGYKQGLSAQGLAGTASGLSTIYWESFPYPTNVWTLTAGTSWQICPGTKLSGSYWYWGTSESVPVAFDPGTLVQHAATSTTKSVTASGVTTVTTTNTLPFASATTYKMDNSLGHELNFYLDQQVVDNLTLTLVAAYMFTDDAFCPLPLVSPGTANGTNTLGKANFGSSSTTTVSTTKVVENALTTTSVTTVNPNQTATNANNYLSPQNQDSWKVGARLQWNF